jgi:hypothetical protein
VAQWPDGWCSSGIRAASPARSITGVAAGPWWASIGLHTVMAAQADWADSEVKPG